MVLKYLFLVSVLLYTVGILKAQPLYNPLMFEWKHPNEEILVKFFKNANDQTLYLKIVKDNTKKPKIGAVVAKCLKYNVVDSTYYGIMTPPDVNLNLNASINFPSKNTMRIVAKKGFIKKTINFQRVDK